MRFILFIIFSLCLPLVMQGQEQNVWTQNDSLKLKKILAGQAEIRINREALRELDRAFSSPRRLFKISISFCHFTNQRFPIVQT